MENGSMKLILFLFLLLISLIIGGLYMIDRVGFYDFASVVMPYVYKTPYLGEYLQPEVVTGEMLKAEELQLIEQSLNRREELLNERDRQLDELSTNLNQKEQRLISQERDLFLKEQALKRQESDKEEKDERLNQLAFYYSNMRPADAARKLELVDKFLVVEILDRIPEKTTVAIILQFMNDDFSQEITRLIGK